MLVLISGFCSIKRLGVFLLPPGLDTSPSRATSLQYVRLSPTTATLRDQPTLKIPRTSLWMPMVWASPCQKLNRDLSQVKWWVIYNVMQRLQEIICHLCQNPKRQTSSNILSQHPRSSYSTEKLQLLLKKLSWQTPIGTFSTPRHIFQQHQQYHNTSLVELISGDFSHA